MVDMTVESQLAKLEIAELVRRAHEAELTYLFKHGLVQETAYGSLLKQDRKRLHREVGEALERFYEQNPAELAAVLGQHFYEAGDDERALKYLTQAGDAAARLYANAEAQIHYSRALEIARQINPEGRPSLEHLYAAYGRVLELTGQWDAALKNYDEMERNARTEGNKHLELEGLIHRATIYSTPTDKFDGAIGLELAEQALALARELGDRAAEARIMWNLLLLYGSRGELRQAIEYGEQSLALARELNAKPDAPREVREQLAFTLNDLGRLFGPAGDSARSLKMLGEASSLWRELGNLPMLTDRLVKHRVLLLLCQRV